MPDVVTSVALLCQKIIGQLVKRQGQLWARAQSSVPWQLKRWDLGPGPGFRAGARLTKPRLHRLPRPRLHRLPKPRLSKPRLPRLPKPRLPGLHTLPRHAWANLGFKRPAAGCVGRAPSNSLPPKQHAYAASRVCISMSWRRSQGAMARRRRALMASRSRCPRRGARGHQSRPCNQSIDGSRGRCGRSAEPAGSACPPFSATHPERQPLTRARVLKFCVLPVPSNCDAVNKLASIADRWLRCCRPLAAAVPRGRSALTQASARLCYTHVARDRAVSAPLNACPRPSAPRCAARRRVDTLPTLKLRPAACRCHCLAAAADRPRGCAR
eukprot:15127-Chlamydomonas_euryale.AAC.9